MRGRSLRDLPLFLLGGVYLVLTLSGCSGSFFSSREEFAERIAASAGWTGADVETDTFRVKMFWPRLPRRTSQATIYIEGDGLAWINRSQPSNDPTPRNPIGLRLAVSLPGTASAYIARPCQYVLEKGKGRCDVAFWTHARYSEPVLTAISQAIDQVVLRVGARDVVLVGYSGGGTIAALLAARRTDVSAVVTVASNLDTDFWVALHRVTPLYESLNPAREADRLGPLPQLHFVGVEDEIVPIQVIQSYNSKIGRSANTAIQLVEGADHDCCWVDLWPSLYLDRF